MAIDKELVEHIRSGKREAYGDLFCRYHSQVYGICLSILSNPQEAEEAAQDVFIHAYLQLDQLRNPDKFLPWLCKIAQNHSRNRLERLHRMEATLTPLDAADSQTGSEFPDEQLLRAELMDAIMEAIEALPVGDREVIKARIDGLEHAQISECLGISVQASLSRLYRARKKVADRVKNLLHSILWLARTFQFKGIISGGIMAMKVGTGIKGIMATACILVVGFTGFQIATRQHATTMEEINPAPEQTKQITAPRFIGRDSGATAKMPEARTSDTGMSKTEAARVLAEVPTAQSSDDEIRDFVAWLSTLDREDASEEAGKDNSDMKSQHSKMDYEGEKSAIESVIWEQWEKGYEERDIELYMSAIWEDDFFYVFDRETPDDPSDDIILRGQQERESAARVFGIYKDIELEYTPRSDMEFLSDTMALVEYNYQIKLSKVPTPDSTVGTFFASGNITIILERRRNTEGKDQWRILEWYDYATPK